MILYALTIFASAFLLFLVQPIMAKQILPWFGGSAAVWTTCLVFFQFLLLFGYAYSDWTTRRLQPRQQVVLHIALLALSLFSLPILADAAWKPSGEEEPGWRILGLLTMTIGLPYFLLSTTGPLVQAWFARTFPAGTVYRLFALSNFASLLALISYPFVLEPWVTTVRQSQGWSFGYATIRRAMHRRGRMQRTFPGKLDARCSDGTGNEQRPTTDVRATRPVARSSPRWARSCCFP